MKYKLILALNDEYSQEEVRMLVVKKENVQGNNGITLYCLNKKYPEYSSTRYNLFLKSFYS